LHHVNWLQPESIACSRARACYAPRNNARTATVADTHAASSLVAMTFHQLVTAAILQMAYYPIMGFHEPAGGQAD
jgi:hypothetical protein